jgi:hypothetical protein
MRTRLTDLLMIEHPVMLGGHGRGLLQRADGGSLERRRLRVPWGIDDVE